MSVKKFCVYKHIFPNGKVYIGITSQKPEHRLKNGKKYAYNHLIGRAIDKYGWENVEHIIIDSGLKETDAKKMEIDLISSSQAQDRRFGYNLTAGGDGMTGFITYESTKKKLSTINTGKKHTNESRKMMSESRKGENAYWYGKRLPEDMREKISQAKKGKRVGSDSYWYGKTMPQSARRKMSENHYDASGENNPRARRVEKIMPDGTVFSQYKTIKQAAEDNQCDVSTVRRRCNGVFNDRHGYIWRYADREE